MITRSAVRKVALVVGATFLSGTPSARDVTLLEISEIWDTVRYLIAPSDEILKVDAYWGESESDQELGAVVTTRPFEVGERLCVTEGYRLRRREGESNFRVANADAPISQYWERDRTCDVVSPDSINEFGVIPDTVMVTDRIATLHVARIISNADEILRLVTPEVRCNERIMTTLFQPGVLLRLTHIGLDRRNRLGTGIQYLAQYSRRSEGNDDGVWVRFSMYPDHFEVTSACYWIA